MMSKKHINKFVKIINIRIGHTIHIEQRAEGGGQINHNVGYNSNQGGQTAVERSRTENFKSQFANGNGRSGIAGKKNDEQGGQEAVKFRNNVWLSKKIKKF
jgi:hypothetical protein